MWKRCGELYRRVVIAKEKIPPVVVLHKGSSVHAGAEVNFKQKIKSYKDLPTSQILEATASAFDDRVSKEGVSLTKDEEKVGMGLTLARAKDRTVLLAGLFAREVAPVHQPKVVEEYQRITLNEEMDLLVKLDLINDKDKIVDVKSGKRTLAQNDVNEDIQFTTYDLAFRAIYKRPPAGIEIENLVDTGVNQKRTVIETSRTMTQLQKGVDVINQYIFGVENGVFLPAPKNSWWCNEEHCQFAPTCKYFQLYKMGGGDAPKPFWYGNWKKKKGKTNAKSN